MMLISAEQFYQMLAQLLGLSRATFKAGVSRGEVCLSFGTSRVPPSGPFIFLDIIWCLLVDELTPSRTRKGAATLVKQCADSVLWAIWNADFDRYRIVYLAVAEYGDLPPRSKARAVRGAKVGFGSVRELVDLKFLPGDPGAERVTLVNIRALIDRARCAAAEIGLTPPRIAVCPYPTNPEFTQQIKQLRAVRHYREENDGD